MSQLKKGALLSYLTLMLTNIIGLMLTPYIIKNLGDSEYGLYILIGGIIGYLTILDLGLNNAIVRYVSIYRAKNDKQGEEVFLGITMFIYFVISLIVIFVCSLMYFNIESIFSKSLTISELEKVKKMFFILIINLSISIPGGTFNAICIAYQKFVFSRTVNIVKLMLRSLLIFLVLKYGGDSFSLVIIDTIMTLTVILITFIYVKNRLNISFKLTKSIDTTLLKEIFAYSIWTFIFSIVIQLQWNTGQIILGIQKNTEIVAVYGLGIILAGYYSVFASSINTMLLPKASNMSVDIATDSKKYTDEMIKIGRINLFVLLFILSGFFLFGEFFIKLWVGDFYLKSWIIAIIIMASLTLQIVQAFGNIILDAMKKTKFKSLLTLFTITASLLFSYYFSNKFSIYGVVIPLAIAIFINSIILNIYYNKVFGLENKRFFVTVFYKPLLVVSILTAIVSFFIKSLKVDSWIVLITLIVFYSLFFIVAIYLIMNEQERRHIKLRIW